MESVSIEQDGNSIVIPVIRAKRRSVVIIIEPHKSIRIRAPLRSSIKFIDKFVASKSPWILKNLARIKEFELSHPVRRYDSEEKLQYLGRMITFKVIFHDKLKRPEIKYYKGTLSAHIRSGGQGDQQRRYAVKKLLTDWYRKRALLIFKNRMSEYSKKLDLRPAKLSLGNAQKRWGSCSSRGGIRVDWKMAMAPLELIDYVIVHELCHLKQKDHSRKFWDIVGDVLPDYSERRRILKRQGHLFTLN